MTKFSYYPDTDKAIIVDHWSHDLCLLGEGSSYPGEFSPPSPQGLIALKGKISMKKKLLKLACWFLS